MKIDENSMIPIYVQIADSIEDDILSGKLKENDTCYSQLVLAKELKVNPATAANLLVSRGILIKHRGQAMTVAGDAISMISERKRHSEVEQIAEQLIKLSKKLSITKEELLKLIAEQYDKK